MQIARGFFLNDRVWGPRFCILTSSQVLLTLAVDHNLSSKSLKRRAQGWCCYSQDPQRCLSWRISHWSDLSPEALILPFFESVLISFMLFWVWNISLPWCLGENPEIPAFSLCRSLPFSFQTMLGGWPFVTKQVFFSTIKSCSFCSPPPPFYTSRIQTAQLQWFLSCINCFPFLLHRQRLRVLRAVTGVGGVWTTCTEQRCRMSARHHVQKRGPDRG